MPGDENTQPAVVPAAVVPAVVVPVAQPVATPAAPAVPAAQPFADLTAANAEIVRLREENAGRRVSNRDLQGELDALKKQAPTAEVTAQIADLQTQLNRYQAAGQAGVSPELLQASKELQEATTAEQMTAATEKITRLAAAPAAPAPRNPVPPTAPTQPQTLDQQIATAEGKGNYRESARLKTQKLTEGR